MQKNKYSEKLVFQFDCIDAIHVQQILMALDKGYKFTQLTTNRGVGEFVFVKELS